jgi:AraC family transcriptional regulator
MMNAASSLSTAPQIYRPASLETEAIPIFQNEDTRFMVSNSVGLGWDNMYAATTNTEPLEELVGPSSFLLFATPLKNLKTTIEIDGRTYDGEMAANSHSVIAPNIKYEINFHRSCSIFYLCIKNEVLSEVANELFRKRVEDIDMYSPLEKNDPGIQNLMHVCMNMLAEPHDSSFRSDYLARAITAEFYSKHTQLREIARVQESRVAFSERQVQRINEYMQANLHDTLQIADIAACIGMSRTLFFERFIHTMKKTPNQYLQILRVTRAKELLADRKLSLTDIAFACGYADQSHFARFFKRFIGASPGKYRQEIAS